MHCSYMIQPANIYASTPSTHTYIHTYMHILLAMQVASAPALPPLAGRLRPLPPLCVSASPPRHHHRHLRLPPKHPPPGAANPSPRPPMATISPHLHSTNADPLPTLLSFLSTGDGAAAAAATDDAMIILLAHLQAACATISSLLASPSTVMAATQNKKSSAKSSSSAIDGRDAPKPMDIVANDIIKKALRDSKKVCVIASEEEDSPVWLNNDGPYVVVFDPLDGSRNIDASIPTGSIFGIYRRLEGTDAFPEKEKAELNVLQRGELLVAAVYTLYSSATILCLSLGAGTHAFTFDHSTGDFILTNPNLTIPERGQIYSVNDARYFDWPKGLQNYIDDIRQGKGEYPNKYSARYICSLVADFHRTILYGGVAMNPRAHLRLVYEANPLSFIVEQAGGKGSDGVRRILDIQPVKLHQRLPLFLGSTNDVEELMSYGNVQQLVNPGYEV